MLCVFGLAKIRQSSENSKFSTMKKGIYYKRFDKDYQLMFIILGDLEVLGVKQVFAKRPMLLAIVDEFGKHLHFL